ncbi:L-lactate permease [Peptoanaerobacter stomatis]
MLNFILALLPIIFLIIVLSYFKMPGFKACPIALIIAALEALFIWKQPAKDVFTGFLEGAAMALWPICLVIIAAIFVYNLVVHTKYMEVIKQMLVSVSKDKRILALIIAWGFGGFMEGMAGFGTAVAIPAGILVAVGFEPLFAAIICLVANTTPVAFGSIGIPTVTAIKVTELDPIVTATSIVLQSGIMSILVPFFLVAMIGKQNGKSIGESFKGVFLTTLISGFSFFIPQYFTAGFIGPELPSIIGSVVCMGVTIGCAKIFIGDKQSDFDLLSEKSNESIDMNKGLVACSPFILVLLFLVLTSSLFPAIRGPLAVVKTAVPIYSGEGAKPYEFSWLVTPGVLIILAGILGGLIQKCSLGEIFGILGSSIKQMQKTIITIVAVISTAKIMGYSGMTQDIANFMVATTGNFYPLIAPLIGAIGTFVTGSSTSSSVLFSKLQYSTAQTLGMNPTWLVAANTVGSTAGKIVSPQSIAVATAAANIVGEESKILNGVVKYFIIFAAIYGLVVFFGANLLM